MFLFHFAEFSGASQHAQIELEHVTTQMQQNFLRRRSLCQTAFCFAICRSFCGSPCRRSSQAASGYTIPGTALLPLGRLLPLQ